jgi:hypothetical protein
LRKYESAIDTSCAFETNYLNLTTANFDSYGNVSFDPCEFTLHTAGDVLVVLSHIFSFTVYATAWWSGFMHPAGLSKMFKYTSTSLFTGSSKSIFICYI